MSVFLKTGLFQQAASGAPHRQRSGEADGALRRNDPSEAKKGGTPLIETPKPQQPNYQTSQLNQFVGCLPNRHKQLPATIRVARMGIGGKPDTRFRALNSI